MKGGVGHAVLSLQHFQFHASVGEHFQLSVAVGAGDAGLEVQGGGRVALVSDFFAVIESGAIIFRPVLFVQNHKFVSLFWNGIAQAPVRQLSRVGCCRGSGYIFPPKNDSKVYYR
jgi:hypothetical protein